MYKDTNVLVEILKNEEDSISEFFSIYQYSYPNLSPIIMKMLQVNSLCEFETKNIDFLIKKI